MDYYDNEFYGEPSEFDIKIDELKKSLRDSIKQEVLTEMESLQKENDELQEIKKNWNTLQGDYARKQEELERTKMSLRLEVKTMKISELFGDKQIIMYTANQKYSQKPKCDKCNDYRHIEYISPLGRKSSESCLCNEKITTYDVAENILYEFRLDRYKGLLSVWYKEYGKDTSNDGCTYVDNSDTHKVFSKGMTYEELKPYWSVYFRKKEDCQGYCDWLNKTAA